MMADRSWRVGAKVEINVYDESGRAVCQTHTPEDASLIVAAVNALLERERKIVEAVNELRELAARK